MLHSLKAISAVVVLGLGAVVAAPALASPSATSSPSATPNEDNYELTPGNPAAPNNGAGISIDQGPAPTIGELHVTRCEQAYRSYSPASDTYVGLDGQRRLCTL